MNIGYSNSYSGSIFLYLKHSGLINGSGLILSDDKLFVYLNFNRANVTNSHTRFDRFDYVSVPKSGTIFSMLNSLLLLNNGGVVLWDQGNVHSKFISKFDMMGKRGMYPSTIKYTDIFGDPCTILLIKKGNIHGR